MIILTIRSGPRAGESFKIHPPQSVPIGRAVDSQLSFDDDEHMSSHHCTLQVLHDQTRLIDCDSTNKTWLNNEPVQVVELRTGDKFRAGKTVFTIRIEDSDSGSINKSKDGAESEHWSTVVPEILAALAQPKSPSASAAAPLLEARSASGSGTYSRSNAKSLLTTLQKPVDNFAMEISNLAEYLMQSYEVRWVVHFQKLRLLTPTKIGKVASVFPNVPSAESHWPVILEHTQWKSATVQSLAPRLCSADAVVLVVGQRGIRIVEHIQDVASFGLVGYCEAGGFMGWCWPSALVGLVHGGGLIALEAILGPLIEGVCFCNPSQPQALIAYAGRDLKDSLKYNRFVDAV